jgi:hypothetical protein
MGPPAARPVRFYSPHFLRRNLSIHDLPLIVEVVSALISSRFIRLKTGDIYFWMGLPCMRFHQRKISSYRSI